MSQLEAEEPVYHKTDNIQSVCLRYCCTKVVVTGRKITDRPGKTFVLYLHCCYPLLEVSCRLPAVVKELVSHMTSLPGKIVGLNTPILKSCELICYSFLQKCSMVPEWWLVSVYVVMNC